MNLSLLYKEKPPIDHPDALWGYRPVSCVTIIQTMNNPQKNYPPNWLFRLIMRLWGAKIIIYDHTNRYINE